MIEARSKMAQRWDARSTSNSCVSPKVGLHQPPVSCYLRLLPVAGALRPQDYQQRSSEPELALAVAISKAASPGRSKQQSIIKTRRKPPPGNSKLVLRKRCGCSVESRIRFCRVS